jgi:hypothetical protein
MLKLVSLALLLATALAIQCECEDSISALEKRIQLIEAKLDGVVGNSSSIFSSF